MTANRVDRVLGVVVTLVVVGAVTTAVFLLDPPGVQRQRRMDQRRVQDLLTLQRSAEVYWTRHRVLPPDLDRLAGEAGLVVPRSDPVTGVPYGYEVTGATTYRLCAVFARDSSERGARFDFRAEWAHGPGRHCFDLKLPKRVVEAAPPG